MATKIVYRKNTFDSPADILAFAVEALRIGDVALATLIEIRGGAARTLGSHVAIAADGGFSGYVSGGCVEAAVAAEALQAIAEGRDRIVAFGEGSPFFDIKLPCGGGITVAVHVLRSNSALHHVLKKLSLRSSSALVYSPQSQTLVQSLTVPPSAEWNGDGFVSVYRPRTRLVISGQAGEVEAIHRLAVASGYAVSIIDALTQRFDRRFLDIDPFTAVVILHHDLEVEDQVLQAAMTSSAFYIGALGSARTHHSRVARLRAAGFTPDQIDRIKAPIGMFGPARDSNTLALSVLADIAATRLMAFA